MTTVQQWHYTLQIVLSGGRELRHVRATPSTNYSDEADANRT